MDHFRQIIGRHCIALGFFSASLFVTMPIRASSPVFPPATQPPGESTERISETVAIAVKPPAPPTGSEIKERIRQWSDRSPAVREAAIRRLLPFPQSASEATIHAFRTGNLSVRLSALELLREWKAPVDAMDPWRPESWTDEHIKTLDDWQKGVGQAKPGAGDMDETLRSEAEADLSRMLRASDVEAEAIRERLTRRGVLFLPLVYEQLKTVTTDDQRRRLQSLRYRLVAAENLESRWPGGLFRLASQETAVRQKSAEEFAGLATAEDQMLLRELFSDPNPLVREICLRGMQRIGGDSQAILLDLLVDPEPNVRAAVLKQLEENPAPGTCVKITEYVTTETDPDLIVHAIRVLKTLHKKRDFRASRSLIELLKHDRWQVRADAAEALGGDFEYSSTSRGSEETKLRAEIYVAFIGLLDDEDSFVVSKAVEGLQGADLPDAVEPLVQVIKRFPDLAGHVMQILNRNVVIRAKAKPFLRELAKDADPRIRAALIASAGAEEETIALGLADVDSRVRIATAKTLLKEFESLRLASMRSNVQNRAYAVSDWRNSDMYVPVEPQQPRSTGVLSSFLRFMSSGAKANEVVEAETVVEEINGDILPPIVEEDAVITGGVTPVLPTAVPASLREGATWVVAEEVTPVPVTPLEGTVVAGGGSSDAAPVFVSVPLPATSPPVILPPAIEMEMVEKLDENEDVNVTLQQLISADASMISPEAYDEWLRDFMKGKGRPTWMETLRESLEKMLSAESVEERIVAAAALVCLGKADEMIPLLLETVHEKPDYFELFANTVPWLPREKRLELFEQWRTRNTPSAGQIVEMIERFTAMPDIRNEAMLWEILGDKNLSGDLMDDIYRKLRQLYLFDKFRYTHRGTPPERIRDHLAGKLQIQTDGGTENQRLVAMAILLAIQPESARNLAGKLDADAAFSEEFRRDMFQIRLLSLTDREQASEIAMETLKEKDPARSKMAIRLLVGDRDGLENLRSRITLYLPGSFSSDFTRDQSQRLPQGLDLAVFKPLLTDENDELAAYAGYFTTLLGDASGMTPLLKYWQKNKSAGDESGGMVRMLLYRAIAATGDAEYVPVLREIYERLDESNIQDFYWSIRAMKGPEILKLRKEIRDKFGVENLM